jgi:hypothetical protein
MSKLLSHNKSRDDLLINLDRLHTTELGIHRIRRNLSLGDMDVVSWCKDRIKEAIDIERRGKNWYVYTSKAVITINTSSLTIITAHKVKG